MHALILGNVNVYAKYKVPSFTPFKRHNWDPKLKMDHVTLTIPLSGVVHHPLLRLTGTSNLAGTFFVASVSTGYEDTKGDAKYTKWGGLG